MQLLSHSRGLSAACARTLLDKLKSLMKAPSESSVAVKWKKKKRLIYAVFATILLRSVPEKGPEMLIVNDLQLLDPRLDCLINHLVVRDALLQILHGLKRVNLPIFLPILALCKL